MDALREYMVERELTQEQIAKMFNVSQPTVCDWLSGKFKPSTDRLIEISRRTGLSIDELIKPREEVKRKRAS